MANYNIYGHVLYSEIQYEDLMHQTEKIFIRSLMAKVPDITDWTNTIWNDIDHEYMIRTLEEIKRDIIDNDLTSLLKYDNTAIDINEVIEASKNLANMYDINNISKFKAVEKAYGKKIARAYKKRVEIINEVDELEYLTQQIKNFSKLEQTIPYYSGGEIIRTVTPSTYLSMLYNVNITRTGWNQTFKDAEYFNKDLMILETHPNSCEHCKPYQGKIYSRTGKGRYPSIEEAYEHIGHPNCKCEFSIYWGPEQMKEQDKGVRGNYEEDQKKKAIEREIRKAENELDLFNMIGNQAEVDKTIQKIAKLNEKL